MQKRPDLYLVRTLRPPVTAKVVVLRDRSWRDLIRKLAAKPVTKDPVR